MVRRPWPSVSTLKITVWSIPPIPGRNGHPGSFLRDANLFLCEATYLADQEGSLQHLSGRQAGSLAASAAVRQLVITHRWPTVSADALALEATEAFGGPVTQAVVGDVLEW